MAVDHTDVDLYQCVRHLCVYSTYDYQPYFNRVNVAFGIDVASIFDGCDYLGSQCPQAQWQQIMCCGSGLLCFTSISSLELS